MASWGVRVSFARPPSHSHNKDRFFFIHSHTQKPYLSSFKSNSTSPSSSSSSSSETDCCLHKLEQISLTLTKRKFNVCILATATIFCNFLLLPNTRIWSSIASEDQILERYTDSKEGFTLLKPSSYIKVEKAGATVLFEEANKGSNNVGVVVTPVRLSTLSEFGTPQFVAEKLIQAEKRKESTKDAEVIGVAERSGQGGQQIYEFEYKVDSTRGGLKRILSAAFVASRKLYLLNIAHLDKPESPIDAETRMMLEEVLHSFDAVPLT